MGQGAPHPPEPLPALLDDLEALELEDVVRVGAERRERGPRNLEPRAPRGVAVEADDRPPPGALRLDDARGLAVHEQVGADGEALRPVARVLDDEGALEPV